MNHPTHCLQYGLLYFTIQACPLAFAQQPQEQFLEKHCYECHDEDVSKGGLDLPALPRNLSNLDILRKWTGIYDRIAHGEMPPEDKEQPSEGEKAAFLATLGKQLVGAEKAMEVKMGKGLVRRMNRTEYEHTLQDLLHLPLLRVKEMLPEDGRLHGYDKAPGALELSHIQMAKYLETADKALRQAISKASKKPETQKWRGLATDQHTGRAAIAIHVMAPINNGELDPSLTSVVRGNPVNNPGNTYRSAVYKGTAESGVILSAKFGAHQPQGLQPDKFRVTTGGWYKFRFSIWGCRFNQGKIEPAVRSIRRQYTEYHGWQKPESWKPDPKLRWIGEPLPERGIRETPENTAFYGKAEVVHVVKASLKGQTIGFYDAPSLEPTEHEFKVWLEPGEKVSFHVMTLSGGCSNSAASNGVRSYEGPGVAFDWFEIEGPLLESWPPQSQQRLFGKTPVGEFPRPMVPGRPVVGQGKEAIEIPHTDFNGAGHKLETEWYLNVTGEIKTTVNFAKPGTYEFRIRAFQTPAGDEPAQLWTKKDGREMPHGRFKVESTRDQPQTFRRSFRVDSAGSAEIGVEFPNDYFDEQTKADRNLVLDKFEILPVKLDESLVAQDTPEPGKLLLDFASAAFRRPVEARETRPYLDIVNAQLLAGQSFTESMIAGYKAILCSPDFLFLGLEGEGYELASRLSYFLWNSAPDAQLRQLAAEGKLQGQEVLLAQTERLLAAPRSDRFINHFLDYWLELLDIDFTTPDKKLYPEFDTWLRDSMLAETRAFFRKMVTDNLDVGHIVDSDFALVNQRLAELYNIRGVAGGKLQKVKLSKDVPRGGLITQASVLKVTANGTATSPVLRGIWMAERIMGKEVKPPPPNIPAVEPDATGAVTIRELIEAHRADPACAGCHRVMDPPGLALESFDVIGGWREKYRASGRPKMIKIPGQPRKVHEPSIEVVGSNGRNTKIRLGGAVDPSGELADGRKFQDIDGLRGHLLSDKSQLARNLAKQLAIYATSKGHRFSDRKEIDTIVGKTRKSGFGTRDILNQIVLSPLFKGNRNEEPTN